MLAQDAGGAGTAQAALLAVDPRTGDVLAFVGGRTYNQSQFNRVTSARRQPGSVFKPFVYLAAFEAAAAEGRTDLTPATIVDDSPTTFYFGDEEWTPGNYGDEYDGLITLRRALAMSRNVATAKVAETGRLRHDRRAVEAGRREHAAAGVPVDRAGRLRGDAVGDRAGLHGLPEPRRDCARSARSCA